MQAPLFVGASVRLCGGIDILVQKVLQSCDMQNPTMSLLMAIFTTWLLVLDVAETKAHKHIQARLELKMRSVERAPTSNPPLWGPRVSPAAMDEWRETTMRENPPQGSCAELLSEVWNSARDQSLYRPLGWNG